MSEALRADIRAAIDKNLSAETAGVLRERLDSIDALEQRVAELTRAKAAADANEQRRVEAGTKLAAENVELTKQVAAFKVREETFANAERQILIASMQREKADAVVDAIRGVVGQVFANTVVRRKVTSSGNVPMGTDQYGNARTAYQSGTIDTTEEEV